MNYEVKRSEHCGEWVAEAIGLDGEVYVVVFAGPFAEERAREYAFWKRNRPAITQLVAAHDPFSDLTR